MKNIEKNIKDYMVKEEEKIGKKIFGIKLTGLEILGYKLMFILGLKGKINVNTLRVVTFNALMGGEITGNDIILWDTADGIEYVLEPGELHIVNQRIIK